MVTRATVISAVSGSNVASKTGDEMVIMGLTTGRYYSLNAVGARFWELIQKPTTIAAAAASIASEFEVAQAIAEADLVELAAQFVREGLASAQGSQPG